MRNGNLLRCRVSEIRVKRIRVNQGDGVFSEFITILRFRNNVCKVAEPARYTNKCQVTDVKGGEMMKKFHLRSASAGVFQN